MKEAVPESEVVAQQWLGGRGGEGVEEGLLFATSGEGDPAGVVQVRAAAAAPAPALGLGLLSSAAARPAEAGAAAAAAAQRACPWEGGDARVGLGGASLHPPACRPLTALRRGWTTHLTCTRCPASDVVLRCKPACLLRQHQALPSSMPAARLPPQRPAAGQRPDCCRPAAAHPAPALQPELARALFPAFAHAYLNLVGMGAQAEAQVRWALPLGAAGRR